MHKALDHVNIVTPWVTPVNGLLLILHPDIILLKMENRETLPMKDKQTDSILYFTSAGYRKVVSINLTTKSFNDTLNGLGRNHNDKP